MCIVNSCKDTTYCEYLVKKYPKAKQIQPNVQEDNRRYPNRLQDLPKAPKHHVELS